MNSVVIGMESSTAVRGESTKPYEGVEYVFTAIYMVEFGMRLFAHHLVCLENVPESLPR